VSVPRRLMAGGVSRAIAQMTLYPLDALRTLAQTRDGRTLADVGQKALVRGCATTSTFALFMGSIQFAVFGACKSRGIPTLLAGALGASASCIVSVPQDVIKQRLITGVYTSFRQAVGTIYKTEGIFGFYSAWKPAMARNVPFVMTTFTTMELLKRERMKRKSGDDRQKELGLIENMVIGMSSALVAGFLTQPADVVKTRMMTQAASTAVPYSSAFDCLQTIVKTEGMLTLFSGLKQRSTYMCLLWGMTFALNGHFTKTHAADKAIRTNNTRVSIR
jgi:solute carrier family 25 S-adenosylmethionine transporter 26